MRLQLTTGFNSYNLRCYCVYWELLQGVYTANMRPRSWEDFVGIQRYDLLDALNVKYLVFPEPVSLPPDRAELVAQISSQPTYVLNQGLIREDLYIYRNRTCLPRAYWRTRLSAPPMRSR